MRTLKLREWTTTPGVSLTAGQRDVLRDLKANVQPTRGTTDTYDVTPGNVVGGAAVDGVMLLIEPKVPISRVLFLLAYTADPSAWREDDALLGDASDLLSGVAALYTKLCSRALGRGLLAGYHTVEDQLHTVRGRIDLAEQLRRRPGLDLPLAVRFEEYGDDTTENRLLLAATQLLRRLPIRSPATRRGLHRLTDTLQNVTPVAYPPRDVPIVRWTRLNAHYRAAGELARLLLQMRTIDVNAGTNQTVALSIDMAALFEEFVRTALREAMSCSPVQFPTGAAAPRLTLDARGLIRLEPDLSYWPSGSCTFIGDVKYKRDTGAGKSADLYQLLAYATAARLDSATLIYAQGPAEPLSHHVPATGAQLDIRHLDLARAPTELLAQLALIADDIRSAPGLVVGAPVTTAMDLSRASKR